MLVIYPAVFHKESSSLWVEFPDLEGCQTCGESLEEVINLTAEALGLYIVSLEENNTPVPIATDIKMLTTDKDSFLSLVSCDINKYRRQTK